MIVKTSKGRSLDMGRLAKENETLIAAGNANMNARGDKLSGGKIVQTKEEIAREYHRTKRTPVTSTAPIMELGSSGHIAHSPVEVDAPRDLTMAEALALTERVQAVEADGPIREEIKRMETEGVMDIKKAAKGLPRKITQGD